MYEQILWKRYDDTKKMELGRTSKKLETFQGKGYDLVYFLHAAGNGHLSNSLYQGAIRGYIIAVEYNR